MSNATEKVEKKAVAAPIKAETKTIERCATCKAFVDAPGLRGECRRHAPTANAPAIKVDDNFWCFEFVK